MSSELVGTASSGSTIYAHILNSTGQRWNGSTFELFDASNYSNYDVATVEQGASGIYIGDFPIAITTNGHYQILFYVQDAGAPANGDRLASTQGVDWDGSDIAEVTPTISGAMSGADWYTYVLEDFKRTDKEDAIFNATKDIIDDIRLRVPTQDDESQTTTTDTISTLGDYRIDLEDNFGMMVANVLLQEETLGRPLDKISKAEFDRRYLLYGTGSAFRGVPEAFCVFGGQILIGPVPNSTDYSYVVSQTDDPHSEYTIDSVSIPFTNRYRLIVKNGVLSLTFKGVRNDDQAAIYGTLYENGMRKLEKREDRNRTGVRKTRYQGV